MGSRQGWGGRLAVVGLLLAVLPAPPAPVSWAVSPDRLENEERDPNSWLMYHST